MAKSVGDQYIVVLKDDTPGKEIGPASNELAARHGGGVQRVFKHAVKGFSARMTESAAIALSEDPRVEYVEEDGLVSAASSQWVAPWGWNLSRIDQRDYPGGLTDGQYNYSATGAGVHVYVIDSGLRSTHQEFAGRASRDFDAYGGNGDDCNGHGTHVAGTIGGSLHGVAKGARLHGVKVLNRDAAGNLVCGGLSGYVSDIIAGIDWVTANRIRPAVANLSIGSAPSSSFDQAVRRCISAGVTVVVAAGNDNQDASSTSPARVTEAITVSATDNADRRGGLILNSFANYGPAVDLFAPGVDVESAWNTSDTTLFRATGTSMASPHVAGVAAQFLQANPQADPDGVQGAIINLATRDHVLDAGAGSPNRLLYAPVNAVLIRETSVTVNEYDHDLDTGIDIGPGEWATISAAGTIYPAWWHVLGYGPEGWDSLADNSSYPLPCDRAYALVGKLGSSYFYVGRSNATVADPAQARRLFLGINDDVPGNGRGAFTCRVQVWRKRPASAIFISQNVPTGMTPGQSMSVDVTMLNAGDTTWTAAAGYKLGSQNPQDNLTWGTHRALLPYDVPPGAQVTIPFNITAPTMLGTYNFRWQMVQEGAEWFGELTDNFPITVVANSNQAQFVSQSVEPLMIPAESYDVTIILKNTGNTIWQAGTAFRLGSQNPQDNTRWGITRVMVPQAVYPGAQVTFTFQVTAPTRVGSYNFQWRMVQEGVGWFGDYTPNLVIQVKSGCAKC